MTLGLFYGLVGTVDEKAVDSPLQTARDFSFNATKDDVISFLDEQDDDAVYVIIRK